LSDPDNVAADLDSSTGIHPCFLGEHCVLQPQQIINAYKSDLDSLVNVVGRETRFARQITKKAFFGDRRLELMAIWGGCHPKQIVVARKRLGLIPSTLIVDTLFLTVSYAVGCAFGRWDIRFATGEKTVQDLPNPSGPLPLCPPGMLQNRHGLPMTAEDKNDAVLENYPLELPWDGILIDDPGHPRDIEVCVRSALEIIWKDRAQEIEHEACDVLGIPTFRDFFRKPLGFFDYHIKCYSKSRRKAPIYWVMATPSISYAVWLYYHRFTKDTFYKVLNDFVKPKLDHEDRKLDRLRLEAGSEPTPTQRQEIDNQEAFVAELKDFREEVERIAPLWNPDLNDGVIINFAPLWHLVPQHRTLQKECKDCWDALVRGNYDWAHLAMHLWPERVVPKCQDDASLAIAHGLDDIMWEQDDKGKWRKKPVSESRIQELITERTKPAVKAALQNLLSAAAPGGAKSRKVRQRKSL
jgi:hypothetical protein